MILNGFTYKTLDVFIHFICKRYRKYIEIHTDILYILSYMLYTIIIKCINIRAFLSFISLTILY